MGGRQSAERRYLRLRTSPEGTTAGTREQRVAAERDRRAGDKAVAGWARDNAAGLRQLAGQIGALTDLGSGADADLAALRTALGHDDAADLLEPLAEAGSHLKAAHPGLSDQVTRQWMGYRPSTPDSLPVIGRSPRSPHVFYAFGHQHLGLTLSAITGRLIASVVSGRTPEIDLAPYRIDRF